MHINTVNRLHDRAQRLMANWQSTLYTDIQLASRVRDPMSAAMYERMINADIKRITAWHRFISGERKVQG